jgi:integrase
MNWSLHDARGRRKYLVASERGAFLQAALDAGGKTASFCAVLTLTGARISEVLALTPERIDEGACTITFETLKRRRRGVYRAVPVPRELLHYLEGVHRYREKLADPDKASQRLWPWSRTTAWRRVKLVMRNASNPDHLSKPKSLRHAFGAAAVSSRVTLSMIKKWMGHARIETTEIYATLVGREEHAIAERTWRLLPIMRRRDAGR